MAAERSGYQPWYSERSLLVIWLAVTMRVDGVGREWQSEARPYLLDQPLLLPVGVLLAAQREQDVVGLKLSDGIIDGSERGVISRPPTDPGANGPHVAKYGNEPVLGNVSRVVDIVSDPGSSPREARRDDEHLGCGVDQGAY